MKAQWILLAALASSSAYANFTQLSLSLGANSMKFSDMQVLNTSPAATSVTNGNSTTRFTPSIADTFHFTFSKRWDWQNGLQYLYFPKATATTSYNAGGARHTNIYVTSHMFLFNTGFGFSATRRLEISAFGGIGTSYNRIGGAVYVNPNTFTGNLTKQNTWKFSWDVGANMNYRVAQQWALGLQYQFIQTARMTSGNIVGNTLSTRFKTNRNVYLATINYLFG